MPDGQLELWDYLHNDTVHFRQNADYVYLVQARLQEHIFMHRRIFTNASSKSICMCMSVYVCVYVYVYVYMHTHMYTYMYMYLYVAIANAGAWSNRTNTLPTHMCRPTHLCLPFLPILMLVW